MNNFTPLIFSKKKTFFQSLSTLFRKYPIPLNSSSSDVKGKGFVYKGNVFVHHSDLPHEETSFHRLSVGQTWVLMVLVGAFIISFIFNWHVSLVFLIATLTFVYFADLLFNFFLIYRSFLKSHEIAVSKQELKAAEERDWPHYTIFCPLYKEFGVITQFMKAINNLDYPKNRLHVQLLLEEDDEESIKYVKSLEIPSHFKVIMVPDSLPKSKPKALNYGLQRAVGEYAVIYDAEDIPDRDQLKKAVLAFEKIDERIICLQAKLNFYNPRHNILTRMFSAEYALWFDLVLTGLQSISAPIPLGGTSNHFKLKYLSQLKGWDAFNVTEDCDLGIRLFKKGYRTAIMDSVTLEEANSDLMNWYRQRSRWIKGYIQTYFVHMRKPREFAADRHNLHIISFQLIVGGKILSMFINPLMWATTIFYFAARAIVGPAIESFFPAPIFYMAAFSLIIGNFLYMYYYLIGCAKRDYDDIMKYMILVPFYWLAMSVAGWKAVVQMIVKPHYWEKTIHGLHLTDKKVLTEMNSILASK